MSSTLNVGGALTAASSYTVGQAAAGTIYSYGAIDAGGMITAYSQYGLRVVNGTAGQHAALWLQNAARSWSAGVYATTGEWFIADSSTAAVRMTISATGVVNFQGGTIYAGDYVGGNISNTGVYSTGNCYLGINGKFSTSTNGFNPSSGPNACYTAQGTYGGGYVLIDGSTGQVYTLRTVM